MSLLNPRPEPRISARTDFSMARDSRAHASVVHYGVSGLVVARVLRASELRSECGVAIVLLDQPREEG